MADSKVCMSCLGTETVFDIFDTHECEGNEEIYSEMLKYCFDILISNESASKYLCENCILKLREAYFFKQNVIRNIKVFELEDSEMEFLEDTESVVSLENNTDSNRVIYLMEIENKRNNPAHSCIKTNEEAAEVISKNNQIKAEYDVDDESNVGIIEETTVLTEKVHLNGSNPAEAVFECEHCPKKFTSKVAIARHAKTHLSGPFACSVCDLVFVKLNSRNAHIWRVHRTTEPYGCSECGQRFTTLHKRLVHLQEAHNVKPQYKCAHCDKIFADASSRWQHVRNFHMRIRNHKCTECKMAFVKRRELLSHMASAHGIGEKRYACDKCNKSFYFLRALKLHIKRHEARPEKLTRFLCKNNFKHQQDVMEHLKTHGNNKMENFEAIRESGDETVVEDDILEGSNDTVYFEVGEIIQ